MTESNANDSVATIEIVAEPSPWIPFLRWLKVSIDIDGKLGRFPWGTHAFVVSAGIHVVVVGTGGGFASKAQTELEIARGEIVRLRYEPRMVKHLRGRLFVERLPKARVVTR